MAAGRAAHRGGDRQLRPPHDPDAAERVADHVLGQSDGQPVTSLHLGPEPMARRPPPRLVEITDPRLHDDLAQEVFSRAFTTSLRRHVEGFYVYGPAIAPEGTVQSGDRPSRRKRVVMLDQGLPLSPNDRKRFELLPSTGLPAASKQHPR